MPLPAPRKGESKNNFLSRYIKAAMNEGKPQKQATAMAYDAWERAKSKGGKR
jgi:hypothetical protein